VKSNVDEKNLDEEISKLKDNLSAKIAERQKAKTNTTRTNGNEHDDLFAMPDRYEVRSVADEDGDPMDVETTTRPTSKRRVVNLSDDDNELPVSKKPRTAARAKPSKPAASTSRQSAAASRTSPAPRRTPARAAASRARKVNYFVELSNCRLLKVMEINMRMRMWQTKIVWFTYQMSPMTL